MKTLRSGLIVLDELYYKILEWKDANMVEFLEYCELNWLPTSVNDWNQYQFEGFIKDKKL